MGAVYIADHLTLHKQVALKIIHPEHAGNAELTARFEREAMATSRIDHPNVISAIDFGTLNDGTAYLAVQLVRGPSLTRVLTTQGAIGWQRAASIGAQIADALSAAHGHGIVHRDLKPDNVLLQTRDDGTELVKVLDFGVAKFAPESKVPLSARTDVTQIGMVVGTPGYMAPEQTIGNPADERSDLYALGVILWEAIVGDPLWSAHDLQALVEKQMSETPRPVREAGPDRNVPEGLERLVAALLSRRAEERPNDAAMVRDELRKFLGDNTPQRWRTGERPVPLGRVPNSSEVTLPLDHGDSSLGRGRTAGFDRFEGASALDSSIPLDIEPPHNAPSAARRGADEPRTATLRPKPSVPPPPPPSLRSRRRLRSSRTAWVLASLLALVVGGATFLVVTGRVELKPAGDIKQIAEAAGRAVQDFQLAPSAHSERAKAAAPPVETGLPPSLAPAFDKLTRADNREERAEGVDALLTHEPVAEVPAYVLHMALLQKAKGCEQKREQLEALAEIGDPRALPVLERLAERGRTGCGKRKREDCFGCLRKPLAALITKLETLPH